MSVKLPPHSYFITVLPSCSWAIAAASVFIVLFIVSVQTIKHLRTAEFKPFVVFVKPPPIDKLRETRKNARIISGKDDKGSAKPFTVRRRRRRRLDSRRLSQFTSHADQR